MENKDELDSFFKVLNTKVSKTFGVPKEYFDQPATDKVAELRKMAIDQNRLELLLVVDKLEELRDHLKQL